MTPRDVALIAGAIGLMVLTVVVLQFWSKWRMRALTEAGKSFGFRRLAEGEVLPVVMVPLINRPDRTYFVILRGSLNGHEAAFFDLLCNSGKSWTYQSTVMVKNSKVATPRFQLKTFQWSLPPQQACGDALKIPGHEGDMGSLRLSADDSNWATRIFSRATPEFLEKLRNGKWTIEGLDHSLVIYRWGQGIPPRKLKEYVRQAGELATEMYLLFDAVAVEDRA